MVFLLYQLHSGIIMTSTVNFSDVNRHHYNLKHINQYLQKHIKNTDKKDEAQILHDKLNELICILYTKQY